MKKNFEIIIGQYSLFSNQNIGIIDAIDVIQIALKKNKFNKIFQYKKQKYIVGYTIDYHGYEVMGLEYDPENVNFNNEPMFYFKDYHFHEFIGPDSDKPD